MFSSRESLTPKFIRPIRFNLDRRRDILEMRTDERESGFMLEDCRFTLTFKRAIHKRELPAGEGFDVQTACVPPKK